MVEIKIPSDMKRSYKTEGQMKGQKDQPITIGDIMGRDPEGESEKQKSLAREVPYQGTFKCRERDPSTSRRPCFNAAHPKVPERAKRMR